MFWRTRAKRRRANKAEALANRIRVSPNLALTPTYDELGQFCWPDEGHLGGKFARK